MGTIWVPNAMPACALLLLLVCIGTARADNGNISAESKACLQCHTQARGQLAFSDKTSRPLSIDRAGWERSVHGRLLSCTECHTKVHLDKHPESQQPSKLKFKNAREYVAHVSSACQNCHYAYYTRVIDSIHYKLRQSGNQSTPDCADCHRMHGATNPRMPRTGISRMCGTCHTEIYRMYRNSVHGKALEQEDNTDVPGCTDCHTAHSISDPRTASFHASSYVLCAKCHSDEEKMKRNNLTAATLKTYLDDFHGKSNRLYNASSVPPTKIVSTCTDCHGTHNISSFRASATAPGAGPQNRAEIRTRVATTCRHCHANSTPDFADAWLSHYPLEARTAPVLWVMKRFYGAFNPFLIGLFTVTILLNLWRHSMRRNVMGRI